jgi:uncharacterized protein (DUF433 family)
MKMLEYEQAVSRDPGVMSGELVFAGTRVPVWMLFDHIRHNHPLQEFFDGYPTVSPEQADVVLAHSMDELRRASA